MHTEPDNGDAMKVAAVVEPLLFRSLDKDVAHVDAVEQPLVLHAVAEPAVDMEIHLRAAHEEGRRSAMAAVQVDVQLQIDAERASVLRVVQQFELEKQRYFSQVEGEVVKLSLAIAERVLHREAAMDPTLLAGAARVALDQVADASEAVLRVHTSEAERWNETLKPAPGGMVIQADESMERGEAVLKTRSGTVQLGLRAQLQEIERGFFELLALRPAAAPAL